MVPLNPVEREAEFSAGFPDELDLLLQLRRDVRRFRTDPIAPELLDEILASAELSPSVGNSQPWRWVEVRSEDLRREIRDNFSQANADALAGYAGERANHYAGLKLSGLDDAPVHLAVFTQHDPEQGHRLGRMTMPQTLEFSTVTAITTLWMAARARGIGVGWVSIIDADQVAQTLSVPEDWSLTAYLCLGYPQVTSTVPELQRLGWQARTDPAERRSVR